VHRFTRHLRGLLVALATLALSAGVVLAARPASVEAPPAAAADGLTVASPAAGKTVPVRAHEAAAPAVDEDEDEGVDKAAPEVEEQADTAEPVVTAGERPQNHGWFVSEAAKAPAPATGNHGQAVSLVARSDVGKPEAATAAAAAKAAKPAKAPKATSH
jgi:hypothetical protein